MQEPFYPQLWQMIVGYYTSQVIYVAAHLGLADLLKDGLRSPSQLARATATHEASLYRLLRALASVGILTENEQGCFGLTPMGEELRSDVPHSLRALALFQAGPSKWDAWKHLLFSIQTGECAFQYHFGMDLWEYQTGNLAENELFQEAMTCISHREIAAILAAFDFSGIRKLIDIGGGNGTLLIALLKSYPALHGVLFERPSVVQEAQARLREAGIAERCIVTGGDMFLSLPQGGDVYLMKSIIHDWTDEQVIALFHTCRNVMSDHAKLLLISRILSPCNMPDLGAMMDLNMLVTLGGRERTADEIEHLLKASGLRLLRVLPTQSHISIIECGH